MYTYVTRCRKKCLNPRVFRLQSQSQIFQNSIPLSIQNFLEFNPVPKISTFPDWSQILKSWYKGVSITPATFLTEWCYYGQIHVFARFSTDLKILKNLSQPHMELNFDGIGISVPTSIYKILDLSFRHSMVHSMKKRPLVVFFIWHFDITNHICNLPIVNYGSDIKLVWYWKNITSHSSSKIKQGNLISLSYKHWHTLVENFDNKRDTVRNIKVMSDVFELVDVVNF